MEQSLADTGDGEELIETKVGGVNSMDSPLQPSQVCLYSVKSAIACLLSGKILNHERVGVHSWNEVIRQR